MLEYLVYRDLERGWRVTAPNLEDCGLLRFDYEGLAGEDGLLEETELWETGFADNEVPSTLRIAPPELREDFIRTLLDLLRRQLAVKVDVLDPGKQHDLVEQTKPRLQEGTAWYLEDERELTKAVVAWPRSRRKGERFGLFVSSYSAFGQYLRRELNAYSAPDDRVGRSESDEIIRFLFLALKRYGIVEQVRGGSGNDGPGYQLNPDALRWLPGSGEDRPLDRTRLADEGGLPLEVNFVECYRSFVDLRSVLEAREHTAQVTTEDRQEREDRFRDGKLPLMFCSPTMELGVDIKQLNLVNLRNVPPTPANYAQRSGRCDSQLEQRWLDCVDKLGVRLPSDAQYNLPGYFTRPDFFYRDANAAIYIDGPPHDAAHQIRDDDGTTEALIERGYIVIRFHHTDDWEAIFRRHPDVFGAPRV